MEEPRGTPTTKVPFFYYFALVVLVIVLLIITGNSDICVSVLEAIAYFLERLLGQGTSDAVTAARLIFSVILLPLLFI